MNYILDGKTPVQEPDLEKWMIWFEYHNRHVGKTSIGGVFISTIFLGVDHSWSRGIKILFETMVFGGKLDQEQKRYQTWDEAEAGHREIVERVKESLKES